MQNAVAQVQNSQSIQQAQTATGVASLLKRRSHCPHMKRLHKKRFRNFIELGKAL
ncbi:RebB family R body protein [Thalassobius aquimarinus]|uniref:RebB family R body protein n=1 Tax=Thalassovita aquimarina TaxID=2785917 RepID=A0ABS5HX28_9RHOB|nr:RebB family R body protein [Thalassovita aquimarina]